MRVGNVRVIQRLDEIVLAGYPVAVRVEDGRALAKAIVAVVEAAEQERLGSVPLKDASDEALLAELKRRERAAHPLQTVRHGHRTCIRCGWPLGSLGDGQFHPECQQEPTR